MSMNTITPILPQILSLLSVQPVESQGEAAPSQAKPTADGGKKQIEAAGSPQTLQLPAFDTMAMPRALHHVHHHGIPKKTSLQQRTGRAPKSRTRSASGPAGNAAIPDVELEEAASRLLSVMARDGNSDITAELEDRYDPLERYQLYEQALSMLDDSGKDSPAQKRIREQLDALKSGLESQYGDAITNGVAATADMDEALAGMEGAGKLQEMNAGTVDDLRAFYGGKGGGRQVSALRSRDMLAKMRETYGDDKVQEALSDLRSKLLGNLSSLDPNNLQPRATGAKLWLSLEDAAAFRTVQSSFAAAHDLRTSFGELGVLPLLTEAGMADCLMSLPEAGKVRANGLINEMADFKSLRAILRAQLYAAIRRSIADLPLTMWPEEKSARNDILAELDSQAITSYIEVPVQSTKEQRRERQMREELEEEEEESGAGGDDRARAIKRLVRRRSRAESSR